MSVIWTGKAHLQFGKIEKNISGLYWSVFFIERSMWGPLGVITSAPPFPQRARDKLFVGASTTPQTPVILTPLPIWG